MWYTGRVSVYIQKDSRMNIRPDSDCFYSICSSSPPKHACFYQRNKTLNYLYGLQSNYQQNIRIHVYIAWAKPYCSYSAQLLTVISLRQSLALVWDELRIVSSGPRLLRQLCITLLFDCVAGCQMCDAGDALVFVASKTDTSFSSPAF